MKTSELTGAALDWAVHVALHGSCEGYAEHEYSTDWSQGGPIIDREKINLIYRPDINCMTGEVSPRWIASVVTHGAEGPTPLIAAMRCYVASKLGDDINIPEELT